jgi:Protein of unknown function (DUF3349)
VPAAHQAAPARRPRRIYARALNQRKGGQRLRGCQVQAQHDYIPLVALLGSQLSDDEVTLVAGELPLISSPESAQEIKKAISAITRTTVSDSDIARVRSHLAGDWPLAAPHRD